MKLSIPIEGLLAIASLVLAVDGAAVRRSGHVVKESQSNVVSLEKRLRQTSDPSHSLYGRHLTAEEVSQYLQPSKRSIEEVELWLRDAGILIDEGLAARSHSKDTFSVHVPAWQARELLQADLGVYEHKRSGALAIRTEQYSVPEHIHEHLDYIGPLTLFAEPKLTRESASKPLKRSLEVEDVIDAMQAAGVPASCNPQFVTSQCLRDYYGMSSYMPQFPKKTSVGVSDFLEQYANFADFSAFLGQQRPDAYQAGYNFTVESINGGLNDQSKPGKEANADVQIVGGIAYPIPFTFYTTPGIGPYVQDLDNGTNEPYEAQMNYLLGLPAEKLPSVLTTSYGDNEQSIPKAYAERVCNYIMALGARGVSAIYSSGDSGVGNNATCFSNGSGATSNGTAMFIPHFPASCPYATAVGATMNFAPEVVAFKTDLDYVSGGGFSNYFPTPWYQTDVVTQYVNSLGDQYQGLYNRSGRGYPDVSAQGYEYLIRLAGTMVTMDGTSLAAPTFASVVALLNDVRITQGLPTLGFLNPLIYKSWLGTQALNDITVGNTAGCGTAGFAAAQGWDPASGAGTPNFEAMMRSLDGSAMVMNVAASAISAAQTAMQGAS